MPELVRLAELKAKYPPAEGPAADISPALWAAWTKAKSERDFLDKIALAMEAEIREAAGTATRLKVDGKLVARRIVKQVNNVSWTSDYYMRVGKGGKGGTDDAA